MSVAPTPPDAKRYGRLSDSEVVTFALLGGCRAWDDPCIVGRRRDATGERRLQAVANLYSPTGAGPGSNAF